MGCGGSTVRASTPVGVQNAQFHKENGRADSAPVNGTQGEPAKCTCTNFEEIDAQRMWMTQQTRDQQLEIS